MTDSVLSPPSIIFLICAWNVFAWPRPSLAKAKRTPASSRALAVFDAFFPAGLAIGEDASGGVAFVDFLLGEIGFGGDFGLVREVDAKDNGRIGRLEPSGDFAGFSAADDNGFDSEFFGQVEGSVDFVSGIGVPPDGDFAGSGGREGVKRGIVGGSCRVLSRVGCELAVMGGVEHGLAEVGDDAHERAG